MIPDQAGRIAAVSGLAGWPVAVPAELPEGYRFEFDRLRPGQRAGADHLPGRAPARPDRRADRDQSADPGPVAAAGPAALPGRAERALVEPVALGDGPAAYALGAWDSEYDPGRDAFVARWRADLPVANVFWQRSTTP